MTFIADGVRYQYGFSMTPQRIVSEHLLVYKAFKPQRWYERRYDAQTGKDVYDFGPGLKGPERIFGKGRPVRMRCSCRWPSSSIAMRFARSSTGSSMDS